MSSLKCYYCKTEINAGSTFCHFCGAKPKNDGEAIKSEKAMTPKKLAFIGFIGLLIFSPMLIAIVGIASSSSNTKSSFSQCIDRGEEYFKNIGSFPMLSTGEDARATAVKRCNRSNTAF